MALADLMKKGFLTSATATVATPATIIAETSAHEAEVARVAVAKSLAQEFANITQIRVAKDPEMGNLLALVKQYQKQDTHAVNFQYKQELYERINNMAYEFMLIDDLGFDLALGIASQIAQSLDTVPCETAYLQTKSLIKKLQNHSGGRPA